MRLDDMKHTNSQNNENVTRDLDSILSKSAASNVASSEPSTNDLQARILSATAAMPQESGAPVQVSLSSKLVSIVSMIKPKHVASFAVAASVMLAAVLWVPSVVSPSGLEPVAQEVGNLTDEYLLDDLEFDLAMLVEEDLFFSQD